jgi:hypothetical protein
VTHIKILHPRTRRHQEERKETDKKEKKKDSWKRDKIEEFSSIDPHEGVFKEDAVTEKIFHVNQTLDPTFISIYMFHRFPDGRLLKYHRPVVCPFICTQGTTRGALSILS